VKNRRSTDVIEMRDRVAIVAHCILNQAARAWWGEGGASREKGMVSDVVGLLARHGVGVIQMGCPEFSLYGNPRRPRSREESDTPEFREKCREIAIQARVEIEALMERGSTRRWRSRASWALRAPRAAESSTRRGRSTGNVGEPLVRATSSRRCSWR